MVQLANSSGGAGWPSGSPPCCATSCCSPYAPELGQLYRDTVILVRRTQVLEVRGDVDLELLGDLIVGPTLSGAMLRPGSSLEEGLSERMVDTLLEGVRPRG
ncbi:hypothetical protein [Streptomyces sp. NPDC002205]|uniref:hypothetical protein n=1 Tax=Streptomyces sp. NPDC002205 TaxID=3154411 RepID=UPI00331911DA